MCKNSLSKNRERKVEKKEGKGERERWRGIEREREREFKEERRISDVDLSGKKSGRQREMRLFVKCVERNFECLFQCIKTQK